MAGSEVETSGCEVEVSKSKPSLGKARVYIRVLLSARALTVPPCYGRALEAKGEVDVEEKLKHRNVKEKKMKSKEKMRSRDNKAKADGSPLGSRFVGISTMEVFD